MRDSGGVGAGSESSSAHSGEGGDGLPRDRRCETSTVGSRVASLVQLQEVAVSEALLRVLRRRHVLQRVQLRQLPQQPRRAWRADSLVGAPEGARGSEAAAPDAQQQRVQAARGGRRAQQPDQPEGVQLPEDGVSEEVLRVLPVGHSVRAELSVCGTASEEG